MNDASTGKPDWQVALGHHEELCAERYNNIDRRFDAVDRRLDNLETDMRELRTGQRWIVGLILAGYFAWPTALIVLLKFF